MTMDQASSIMDYIQKTLSRQNSNFVENQSSAIQNYFDFQSEKLPTEKQSNPRRFSSIP